MLCYFAEIMSGRSYYESIQGRLNFHAPLDVSAIKGDHSVVLQLTRLCCPELASILNVPPTPANPSSGHNRPRPCQSVNVDTSVSHRYNPASRSWYLGIPRGILCLGFRLGDDAPYGGFEL